ncbi:MAG: hypothetical protein ACO1OQ_05960 [Rufibacter sp.]
MPIERSQDQPHKSLEEFYQELIDKGSSSPIPDIARDMISLIKEINSTFIETTFYGLTSHARLIVQADKSWDSKWYIIISSNGQKEYDFRYLLPESERPWPDASVTGRARGISDAIKYLAIAMQKSKGWPNNEELKRLAKFDR